MKKPNRVTKKQKKGWLPTLLIVAIVGIVFIAGGFGFAATQEQHDSFCASCHT